MTTYGEAYQMGLTANLIEGMSTEVTCAGDTLSQFAEKYEEELPNEVKGVIAHVLNHLSITRELFERVGDEIDARFQLFDSENPGKLAQISNELRESQVIADMQAIIGMTPEDVLRIIAENAEALAEIGDKN